MLAPGFMVGLNVLDDPDFSGSFRIDEQGNIFLPILGTVHIAGETISEARTQIKKRLQDDQILRDPQVEITVLEYTETEVTIIGEVASPGKHPLLSPHKLVDVLALAGGITQVAGNQILITRGNSGGEPVLVHYSKSTDPKTVDSISRESRRYCPGEKSGGHVRAGRCKSSWRVCDAGRRHAQCATSHLAG